ncbi:hypothetical protein [Rubrobacter marinus]
MSAKEERPQAGHEPRTRACPDCGQAPGSPCLTPSGSPLSNVENPVHHTSRVAGRRGGVGPRSAPAENPASTPSGPAPTRRRPAAARPKPRERPPDGRDGAQPMLF